VIGSADASGLAVTEIGSVKANVGETGVEVAVAGPGIDTLAVGAGGTRVRDAVPGTTAAGRGVNVTLGLGKITTGFTGVARDVWPLVHARIAFTSNPIAKTQRIDRRLDMFTDHQNQA
jgi:hypothetical protein